MTGVQTCALPISDGGETLAEIAGLGETRLDHGPAARIDEPDQPAEARAGETAVHVEHALIFWRDGPGARAVDEAPTVVRVLRGREALVEIAGVHEPRRDCHLAIDVHVAERPV